LTRRRRDTETEFRLFDAETQRHGDAEGFLFQEDAEALRSASASSFFYDAWEKEDSDASGRHRNVG